MRRLPDRYQELGLYEPHRTLLCETLLDDAALEHLFCQTRPEVVLNCVGVIKQREASTDPVECIGINSLLPHRLAHLGNKHGARILQMSTDCVFSGKQGHYTEADLPDATDLYGRSKLLGELYGPNCITLRTSIIGRELGGCHSLLEWFLSNEGKTIKGFEQAVFSGFTTMELARIIERILVQHPQLSGLWHVSATPITKLELLRLFQRHFNWKGSIETDSDFHCDRSLNSERFQNTSGYCPPSWSAMISEMAAAPV